MPAPVLVYDQLIRIITNNLPRNYAKIKVSRNCITSTLIRKIFTDYILELLKYIIFVVLAAEKGYDSKYEMECTKLI